MIILKVFKNVSYALLVVPFIIIYFLILFMGGEEEKADYIWEKYIGYPNM